MGTITGYSSAPTYVKIASQTLGSAAGTVTFSSIPSTYTDLVLVCNVAQASSNNSLRVRFNGDTGTNYSYTSLKGNGSSALSSRETNISPGLLTEVGFSTSFESISIIQIQNYSNTTIYKTHIGRGNRASSGLDATVGLWRNNAAITSIALAMGAGFPTDNFATGSTFTLYGIKAATTEVFGRAKASGGDSIVTDGTYIYHTFKTSGIFTPFQSLTADVLVVAGGGSGGADANGASGAGGGAGGLCFQTGRSVSATNYTVTIGAGGASSTTKTNKGSNSVFDTITANGGGGGSYLNTAISAEVDGGSGGGQGTNSSGVPGGPTGASNQGNSGGATGYGFGGGTAANAGSPAYTRTGGGGGSGASGANATSTKAGDGGIGLNTWSSWLFATRTGISGYIAGGGGGGGDYRGTFTLGSGGLGGGGNGGYSVAPISGTANTGGGGGGKGYDNATIAGAGGSGLVIVRYAI